MYTGPASGPFLAAAAAWDVLATEMYSAASVLRFGDLRPRGLWLGPSSVAMAAAAAPFMSWISATAGVAEANGMQATAAVAAYEAAFAMTVPPPVIAANRALLSCWSRRTSSVRTRRRLWPPRPITWRCGRKTPRRCMAMPAGIRGGVHARTVRRFPRPTTVAAGLDRRSPCGRPSRSDRCEHSSSNGISSRPKFSAVQPAELSNIHPAEFHAVPTKFDDVHRVEFSMLSGQLSSVMSSQLSSVMSSQVSSMMSAPLTTAAGSDVLPALASATTSTSSSSSLSSWTASSAAFTSAASLAGTVSAAPMSTLGMSAGFAHATPCPDGGPIR